MGAEVDYRESLQGAQFVIRNPNAKIHLRLRQQLHGVTPRASAQYASSIPAWTAPMHVVRDRLRRWRAGRAAPARAMPASLRGRRRRIALLDGEASVADATQSSWRSPARDLGGGPGAAIFLGLRDGVALVRACRRAVGRSMRRSASTCAAPPRWPACRRHRVRAGARAAALAAAHALLRRLRRRARASSAPASSRAARPAAASTIHAPIRRSSSPSAMASACCWVARPAGRRGAGRCWPASSSPANRWSRRWRAK